MIDRDTLIHAVAGAVVGILLSFIPFSTVIGGALAGFLEGSDHRDGAIAGALAGAITFLPAAAIAMLAVLFVGFGTAVAAVPLEGAAFLLVGVLFAFGTILIYTVGLALLGGFLGAVLAEEFPDRRLRTRRTIGLADRPRRPDSSAGQDRSRPPRESAGWTGGVDDPEPWDDAHGPRSTRAGRGRRREEPADDGTRWREDHAGDEPEPELEDLDTDEEFDRE